MLFLVNPPRRKGGRVAKRRKARRRRKLTQAQVRAGFGGKRAQAALKGKRRAKRASVARTRSRKRKGATTVARKRGKRRGTARRRTTSRKRRRTTGGTIKFRRVRGSIYRKNPGLFGGRIVRDIVDGAQSAAAVIAGKVAARMVGNLLPLPKTTVIGNIGTQIVSALVVGMAGKRFLPAKFGDYVFVGALTAPVEAGLRLVPGVGGMLGEDPFLPVGEDPFLPVGSYPLIGSYPEGVGEEVEAAEAAFGY